MNNVLVHYGVKGMKWGVRKEYERTGGGGGGGWGPNTVAGGGGPSPLAASMAGNPKKKKTVGKNAVEKMGVKDNPGYNSKRLIKDLKKAGDWDSGKEVVKKTISDSDKKELVDAANKVMNSRPSDEDREINRKMANEYEAAYDDRMWKWAVNDLKTNNKDLWEIIESEAKEGGFDPLDHEYVEQHAYENYEKIEPFDPPETQSLKNYMNAIDDYNSTCKSIAEKMISASHDQPIQGIDSSAKEYVQEMLGNELIMDFLDESNNHKK